MPTERNNGNFKNYAFLTALERVYCKLIELDGITFQNMDLKVQEARRPYNRFTESKKYCEVHFPKQVKNTAGKIYLPNSFELLHCETTENDENDQDSYKSISIVCTDT